MAFLYLIITASFFILGLTYVTQYDIDVPAEDHDFGKVISNKEIFWFVRYALGRLLGKTFFWKPVLGCAVCMASVWGSLFFWGDVFASGAVLGWALLPKWFVFCVCVAGANYTFKKQY